MNIVLKLLIVSLLFLISTLYAGAFNDRYPSARAAGLSNAFTAVANDVWAAYYNPAGLAQNNYYSAGFAYQRIFNLSFLKSFFLAANVPLPEKYGTVAFSAERFGVDYEGDWMSSESTLMLSHGFYLLNDAHSSLSFGYNLKYFYWELPESVEGRKLGSAGTFGLDVGFMASVYHRTYLGVYVYNLNAPTFGVDTQQELPQRVSAGIAYRPVTELVTSFSLEKTVGLDTQLMAGLEYRLIEYLSLRLGASTMPNRLSAGLSIYYAGFQIDYGFRNHPVLAETHQFSIIYNFE